MSALLVLAPATAALVVACTTVPTDASAQQTSVPRPVLVTARPLAARYLEQAVIAGEPVLGGVYEVRIEVRQVLAGADEGSMEADQFTVRLNAGDAGYLRGNEIVVLLDPERIRESVPLYWRRFTRFACLERGELDRSGVMLDTMRAVTVGNELCLYYAP